jgi:hypothetical protein
MPLLQADAAGDIAYLAYDTTPGPIALWNSATPNIFSVSAANDSATDIATSADGTSFILRANNTTEIRAANLSLVSAPTQSELETIPNRVAVPGIALYPTGALIYEPFLDGPHLPLYPPPEFVAALTEVTRTRASFVSVSSPRAFRHARFAAAASYLESPPRSAANKPASLFKTPIHSSPPRPYSPLGRNSSFSPILTAKQFLSMPPFFPNDSGLTFPWPCSSNRCAQACLDFSFGRHFRTN